MKLTHQKLKQIIKEQLTEIENYQKAAPVDEVYMPKSKAEALQSGLDKVRYTLADLQSTMRDGLSTDADITNVLNGLIKEIDNTLLAAKNLQ
jgi:hypothetical protein